MALKDDVDLITAKMVMNFDIIYDADIGATICERCSCIGTRPGHY